MGHELAQNNAVTFSSTKTTETFNDKTLVDTVTTVTTNVTLSTAKGHEGEFLGASTDTTTRTKDLTAGTTTTQTSTAKLDYAQAVNAAGGGAGMARIVDAVTPGLGTHFASITAQDARAHPYKYAGAAASAAISVIDPPATIGAALRALVPAVLGLLDSTTGP